MMARGSKYERAAFHYESANCLAVEEQVDWQFNDVLNFSIVRLPDWFEIAGRGRYPRSHEKVAGENIAVWEVAENLDRRIEAEFLVEFTQGRFGGRFAGVDRSAGQADLAGVTGERVGAFGEWQVPFTFAAEK